MGVGRAREIERERERVFRDDQEITWGDVKEHHFCDPEFS